MTKLITRASSINRALDQIGDRGSFAANGSRRKPLCPALGRWELKYAIRERDVTAVLAVSAAAAPRPHGAGGFLAIPAWKALGGSSSFMNILGIYAKYCTIVSGTG